MEALSMASCGAASKAMRMLDRSIMQNPHSATLYACRARLELEQSFDHGHNGDKLVIRKIERDLKESFALDRRVGDAYYVRARLAVLACEDASASPLKDLSKAIELTPGNIRARLLRSEILDGDGKYKEALQDLDACVKLIPSYEMYMKRALLKRHAGDLQGAIEDYTSALNGGPAGFIHTRRGDVYEQAHQFEKAIADQRQALALDLRAMDQQGCHRKIARMLCELKRYDEAAKELEKILSLNADDFPAVGEHLTCEMKMKNWAAALRDVNKLIAWESGYAGYYKQRAEIYRALGKADLAAADEKKAQQMKE